VTVLLAVGVGALILASTVFLKLELRNAAAMPRRR